MIKLLVPTVPSVEQAMPYIKLFEEARHYSNFGPCVRLLEERLSVHFANAYVVSCSSCTTGLELVYTLKMIEGYRKIPLPALTFPATWLAANRSGLHVIPIDVDKDTWVAPGVSGFGVPTYAPVVDAAGAFGEQHVPILKGGMTAIFSLHATKPLGAGEGGFIVTWDEGEAQQLREMTNFGIQKGMSVFTGTNAKMSEYHAAIALAALDAFSREPWMQLYDWYDKHLPPSVVKQKRPRGAYSLLPVRVPIDAGLVLERMRGAGVECRRWYTPILTNHPLFQWRGNRAERRKSPQAKLPVSEDLQEHLLGLPYHLHLTEDDVKRVCETLSECVEVAEVEQ